MLAILNSLNAHNVPILQPILMIVVSKFMVHRALSDKNILIIWVAVPFNPKNANHNKIRLLLSLLKSFGILWQTVFTRSDCSYMSSLIWIHTICPLH